MELMGTWLNSVFKHLSPPQVGLILGDYCHVAQSPTLQSQGWFLWHASPQSDLGYWHKLFNAHSEPLMA
jgi:hypothetical protein